MQIMMHSYTPQYDSHVRDKLPLICQALLCIAQVQHSEKPYNRATHQLIISQNFSHLSCTQLITLIEKKVPSTSLFATYAYQVPQNKLVLVLVLDFNLFQNVNCRDMDKTMIHQQYYFLSSPELLEVCIFARSAKWYFVTKIGLTYCEKILLQ